MADLSDLVFIPNDHHTKKTTCICGCPPPFDADTVPESNNDKDIEYNISNIRNLNFLKKPFCEYDDAEKIQLKADIADHLDYRRFDGQPIKDNRHRIEYVFQTVLMFPELISVQDFLLFMEWTPEKNSWAFYICLEVALENFVYLVNSKNWRNQTQLIEPVKVFFDKFHGDINYEFIRRHNVFEEDSDEDGQAASTEIYYHQYPLHMAMARNMPKEVGAYLLGKGANPYLSNKHCNNAFYSCLTTNNPDVFDLFMDMIKRETPDSPKKLLKIDPFIWACDPHSPARLCVFEKLLELGFNINAPDDYPPIINLFCSNGASTFLNYYKYQIFVWMVEFGKANVNVRGKGGKTLLHFFCTTPPSHFIHPMALDYILRSHDFSWSLRDDAGLTPCEYLLDYHLECYHDDHDDHDDHGAKLPNFLCQVILKTGLGNITDAGLPDGLQCGDRVKLAKVILFLKYRSLLEYDSNDPHIRDLVIRIENEWVTYYVCAPQLNKWVETLNIARMISFYCITRDIMEMFTVANDSAEDLATCVKYRQLIKKIIMTDSIREENNSNDEYEDETVQ